MSNSLKLRKIATGMRIYRRNSNLNQECCRDREFQSVVPLSRILYYFPVIGISITIKRTVKEQFMYRWITSAIAVIAFAAMAQTPQFSIRAASSEPVTGWDRMELDNRVVWVSPTVSLTSADVAKAEPITMTDGKKAISVEFTDEGAAKMRRLSAAQMDKLIAMVLDSRLIWAPRVRSEIGKQGMITGNSPTGLDDETIQRILSSVKR
jgi:hypothetical protein